jgi:hypothetical protein
MSEQSTWNFFFKKIVMSGIHWSKLLLIWRIIKIKVSSFQIVWLPVASSCWQRGSRGRSWAQLKILWTENMKWNLKNETRPSLHEAIQVAEGMKQFFCWSKESAWDTSAVFGGQVWIQSNQVIQVLVCHGPVCHSCGSIVPKTRQLGLMMTNHC